MFWCTTLRTLINEKVPKMDFLWNTRSLTLIKRHSGPNYLTSMLTSGITLSLRSAFSDGDIPLHPFVCSCVASLRVCVMRFVHASCLTSQKLLHQTPNSDSTLTLIFPTHIQQVTKPSKCETSFFISSDFFDKKNIFLLYHPFRFCISVLSYMGVKLNE